MQRKIICTSAQRGSFLFVLLLKKHKKSNEQAKSLHVAPAPYEVKKDAASRTIKSSSLGPILRTQRAPIPSPFQKEKERGIAQRANPMEASNKVRRRHIDSFFPPYYSVVSEKRPYGVPPLGGLAMPNFWQPDGSYFVTVRSTPFVYEVNSKPANEGGTPYGRLLCFARRWRGFFVSFFSLIP